MMITEEKKQEKIAMAKAHAKADRLVAGFFTHDEDNKGCSVGCDAFDIRALKGDDWYLDDGPDNYHAYVADYFGTPEWLEHLRDAVFEGLPQKARSEWHVNIAEALPVGVDFQPIKHRILRDILLEVADKSIGDGDEDWRIACRAAVLSFAALHDRAATKTIQKEEWDAADDAARAAGDAARAARAAWDARAAWAARAARDAWDAARAAWAAADDAARAADDAARAAWDAAWAARAARDAWDAGDAAYHKIAEITLKHLREAGS